MHISISRRAGFTLVEIMIVVAIIGVILAIAIPNFVATRTSAQTKVCVENLSQIESAKQQWGVEVGRANGDVPVALDLIGSTSYLKQMPQCPAGGTYNFQSIGSNATCTIGGHSL